MTSAKLEKMSSKDLVKIFEKIALEQDEALLMDEYAKYNRLFDEMELLEQELKKRDGDQRRLLLALFPHPNAEVRLKAAMATLAIDLAGARETLQKIVDQNEFPQAAKASGMMSALDEGRYIPN